MSNPPTEYDPSNDISMDDPMVGSEMYPLARIDLKCGDCGAEMRLRTSPKWDRPFYGCSKFPECRGSHGARTDGAPLGVPGNKETKLARIRAHKVFDVLWQVHVSDMTCFM